MTTFERSPEDYALLYLFGQRKYENVNMTYGSMLADGLENDEATGDPLLDIVMARLPKFELMDKAFEAELKDGKETIILLAKPDTCKKDYSAFKEYKTSVRNWTQKMADESGQLTFYATAIWLKTGKIPQDIELLVVRTAYDENSHLAPTGEIVSFKTKRTLVDIIRMTGRIKSNWNGIKKLCQKELL